jgi:hypothetical protein
MLKQLLIFIALFTICFCEKVSVYKCDNVLEKDFLNKDESEDLFLDIDGCAADTCVIHKGKNKTFSINFKPRIATKNVVIEVWGRFHLTDRIQIEQFIQYEQKICKNETVIEPVPIDSMCQDSFKERVNHFNYTMKIIPILLPTSKVELMLILKDKSDPKKHKVVSCGYIHAMFED